MHTLVLRSGTVLQVSDAAAKLLIDQVTSALMKGSPVSVSNGIFIRSDDVLLVAPSNDVAAETAPAVRLNAAVTTKPRADQPAATQ